MRLTTAQALVRWLTAQRTELPDGRAAAGSFRRACTPSAIIVGAPDPLVAPAPGGRRRGGSRALPQSDHPCGGGDWAVSATRPRAL